jgi:hypothetical protein
MSGTQLKVSFTKPTNTAIGITGPWNYPPVAVTPSILTVDRTSINHNTLTALLTAEASGTATVQASFGQECAQAVQTDCTIPPQATMDLTVKVESR